MKNWSEDPEVWSGALAGPEDWPVRPRQYGGGKGEGEVEEIEEEEEPPSAYQAWAYKATMWSKAGADLWGEISLELRFPF